MPNSKQIDGFTVEFIPLIHSGKTRWSAWLIDLPFIQATCSTLPEALEALSEQWTKAKDAYREAGVPIPKPRGSLEHALSERNLATIQRLAERKTKPIF